MLHTRRLRDPVLSNASLGGTSGGVNGTGGPQGTTYGEYLYYDDTQNAFVVGGEDINLGKLSTLISCAAISSTRQ